VPYSQPQSTSQCANIARSSCSTAAVTCSADSLRSVIRHSTRLRSYAILTSVVTVNGPWAVARCTPQGDQRIRSAASGRPSTLSTPVW